MELLTPDEFFQRVGVRVPDSVIRNLEARRAREWFVGPYIPITDEIVADMCIPEAAARDGSDSDQHRPRYHRFLLGGGV